MGKLSKILASEGVLPKQAGSKMAGPNTLDLGREVKKILEEAISEAGLRVFQKAAAAPREDRAYILRMHTDLEKIQEFIDRTIAS